MADFDNYPQRHPVCPPSRTLDHHQKDTYLPGYIRTFSVTRPEDLEILRARGVFVLLPYDLQVLVLDQFEQFIHPLLPVLDALEFRAAICGGDQGSKIPLILYHTVMFVGLGAMKSEVVKRFLFTPTPTAREAFYEKAKALYDMNVEQDRVVLCQVSILLTERIEMTDPKNAIFLIGNAIAHAHNAKLYRQEPISSSTLKRNLRKILWWIVLIKECTLCMGLSQPPRIWPFDTPLVTMRDFALEEAESNCLEQAQHHKPAAATLALMFIHRVRMFSQIFHVLRTLHEVIGRFHGTPFSGPHIALRQNLSQLLYSWYSEVPSGWWVRNMGDGAEIVTSQRSMLALMASTEIPGFMAEHGPQARHTRQLLHHAAGELVSVAQRVFALDSGQYISGVFVFAVFSIAAIFFQDSSSPDVGTRENSLRMINACLDLARRSLDKAPNMAGPIAKMEHSARALQERLSQAQGDTTLDPEGAPPSLIHNTATGLQEMAPHDYPGGKYSDVGTDALKEPDYSGIGLGLGPHGFDWVLTDVGV
ncbi:hypothetical protein BJY00DRAFT_318894 [Aspergillus carlsbadensis]|nr:hypothetical protein BJY00DRAFT_318894 [Aspergillus carlsbadensis]